MTYKDAIKWLVDNDDCNWCDPSENPDYDTADLSVTASFVADCFRKDDETIRKAIRKEMTQRHAENRAYRSP